MTKRFGKSAIVLAALAMGGMFGATSARADLVMTIQEDGGTVASFLVGTNTGPSSFAGDINSGGIVVGPPGSGDITFEMVAGGSNSPGSLTAALLTLKSFSVTNNTNAQHTVAITVSAQGFTTPSGLTTLVDTVSGTLFTGGVSGTFQAFADASNTLGGTATPGSLIPFSKSGDSVSFNGDGAPVGFATGGTPYSLTIHATFVLDANSQLTGTSGNAQVKPTPEPASMASAVVGLGLIGGIGWVRRRNRQS